MQKFTNELAAALGADVWQYAETEVKNIEFSEAVVAACKANYCGRYNKTWMCPPAVGTLEQLKAKYGAYKYAFVFTTKHDVEDSFDIEGMFAARKVHEKIESKIYPLTEFADCSILGAGGCSICEKCAYPDAPCRFPKKAKPSVEACGINVVNLAATCGINYINGENTVTYFSVVLFN